MADATLSAHALQQCTPSNPQPAAPQVLVYVVRGRPGPTDRPALPSGHPESWGAITRGTVLDQSIYPFPVFMDLPQ